METVETIPFGIGVAVFLGFVVIISLVVIIFVREMYSDYSKGTEFNERIKVRVLKKRIVDVDDHKTKLSPWDSASPKISKYYIKFQKAEIYVGDNFTLEVPKENYDELQEGDKGVLTHNLNVFVEFRKITD